MTGEGTGGAAARPLQYEFFYQFTLLLAPPFVRRFYSGVINEAGGLSLRQPTDPGGGSQKVAGVVLALSLFQLALTVVLMLVLMLLQFVMDPVLHIWASWMWPIWGMVFLGGPFFLLFLLTGWRLVRRLPYGSRRTWWLLNLSPLIWPLAGLGLWQLISLAVGVPQV